jgi:hypothetical protein
MRPLVGLQQEGSAMMELSKKELRVCEALGMMVTAAGLVTVLLTAVLTHNPESFWDSYFEGFRVAGWIALLTGALWTIIASLRLRTTYFLLEHPMDADKAGFSIGAIVVAAGVLLLIVLPMLPTTANDKLPGEPKARAQVVRVETDFKLLVTGAIALTGGLLAFFPLRKLLTK